MEATSSTTSTPPVPQLAAYALAARAAVDYRFAALLGYRNARRRFRFDLAATLARQFQEVDKLSAFFDIVEQDPIISRVKLIAEPWDLGSGGYQVGGFPSSWSEWNGRYRDTVRDFWRSQPPRCPNSHHASWAAPICIRSTAVDRWRP